MAVQNTERGGLATFSLVIKVGEKRVVGARGVFVRVKDAAVPLLIETRSSKIGRGDGRAFANTMKKFEKIFTDTEFDEVTVSHESASDQNIELQIGYGDYEAEIISRTLAANSWVSSSDTNVLGLSDEPPAITLVEIPENLQRKRIKVRIILESSASTNPPVASPDIYAVYSSADENVTDITDPDLYIVEQQLELGPDLTNVLFTEEMEFETTAAIFVGLVPSVTEVGAGDDITYTYRVMWAEEVYSAA